MKNFIVRNYYRSKINPDEVKITLSGLMFYDDLDDAYENYESEEIENYSILNWFIEEMDMSKLEININ